MISSIFFRLFLLLLLSLSPTSSKVVLGISDRLATRQLVARGVAGEDWVKVGSFCYTIGKGKRGILESETMISDIGHQLILLKDQDEKFARGNASTAIMAKRMLELGERNERDIKLIEKRADSELSQLNDHFTNNSSMLDNEMMPDVLGRNQTVHSAVGYEKTYSNDSDRDRPLPLSDNNSRKINLSIPLPSSSPVLPSPSHVAVRSPRDITSSLLNNVGGGGLCEELVKRSRVTEKLDPLGSLSAYHLVLWVEASLDRHRVSAIITRCQTPPSAEYRIEFRNPGGISTEQFSCEDQGLLELYTGISIFISFVLIPCWKLWKTVNPAVEERSVVSALCLAIISYYGSTLSFWIHLLVYSKNGIGFGVMIFLGNFFDFIYVSSITFILMTLLCGDDERISKEPVICISDRSIRSIIPATSSLLPALLQATRIIISFVHHLLTPASLFSLFLFFSFLSFFLSTMVAPASDEPLTPGWGLMYGLINGERGGIGGAASCMYLIIRLYIGFLLLQRVFVRFVVSPPPSTPSTNSDNLAEISTKWMCRFGGICCVWMISLPFLSFFCPPPIASLKHSKVIIIQIINIIIIFQLFFEFIMCANVHLFNISTHPYTPVSTWEKEGLVNSNLVDRKGANQLTSFETPAWERISSDEQHDRLNDDGDDDVEPELLNMENRFPF